MKQGSSMLELVMNVIFSKPYSKFLCFCFFLHSLSLFLSLYALGFFSLSLPVDGWCLYWWWYVGWIFLWCVEDVMPGIRSAENESPNKNSHITTRLRKRRKRLSCCTKLPTKQPTSQPTDRPIYNNNCIYKYRVFDFRMVFNIFHLLGKCSNFQCIIHDMTASMEVGTF